MKRRLFAVMPALAAIASGSRRKDDVWYTPQGQYVLGLRAELERLGYFDDLPEDWEAVERALREGCMYYEVRASREVQGTPGKILQRIVPCRTLPTLYKSSETQYVRYVKKMEWGR